MFILHINMLFKEKRKHYSAIIYKEQFRQRLKQSLFTVNIEKRTFMPCGSYIESLPNYNELKIHLNTTHFIKIKSKCNIKNRNIILDSNLKWGTMGIY